MIKFINIIIFLILSSFVGKFSYADSKPNCSQYSTKTFAGLSAKMRCKRGLPPRESFFDFFKMGNKKADQNTSNAVVEKKKSCDEYSTKTFAGLIGKIRCKRK